MRPLKVIIGMALLMATAACAYYGPGPRPYYYHDHPRYYRY
jgi:hypothetical protein